MLGITGLIKSYADAGAVGNIVAFQILNLPPAAICCVNR